MVDVAEVLKLCVAGSCAAQRFLLSDLLRVEEVLGGHSRPECSLGRGAFAVSLSPPSPEHSSAFPPRPSHSIQLTPEQQLLIAERIAQRFHVESKGQLLHKSTGTNDFVTMADVLAQRIIGAFLLHRLRVGRFDAASLLRRWGRGCRPLRSF